MATALFPPFPLLLPPPPFSIVRWPWVLPSEWGSVWEKVWVSVSSSSSSSGSSSGSSSSSSSGVDEMMEE